MKEVTVKDADADIRLDRWFKRHFPHMPHALLEKSLRKGAIKLDGKKAKSSDRVQAGQVIRMPEIEAGSAPVKPRQRVSAEKANRLKDYILYQDASMIILNKPAGLAVQGGTGQKESVDAMLDALAENGERPKLVHRLDKDTSGVLALARNAKTAAKLAQAFAQKDVTKTYWALVIGAPSLEEGVIDLPLAKLEKGAASRTQIAYEMMEVDEEEGKRAITEWRVIERLGTKLTWMELVPVTGRTHQLRVHMAAIGHPIVGDGKYGGAAAFASGTLPRQLHLHARRLALRGEGGKKIDVKAPLPPHMQESWDMLGLSVGKK